MKKIFTLSIVLLIGLAGYAQDTLSYWDFNSSNATPNIGSGTFSHIGSAANNGYFTGSTNDPAATDRAYSTNNYPPAGTNPRTAGVQIDVPTTGYENIKIKLDIRFSNTAPDTWVLQYTTDISSLTPTWNNADTFFYSSGSTWFVDSFDFSGITALENNPNAAFRLVSDFNSTTGDYDAVGSSSTYGSSGTVRFDLVTITGDQLAPVPYEIEFSENSMTILENAISFNVVAEITSVGSTNSSIDLAISPLSNATASDYTQISTTANIPSTKMIGDTILFSFMINDDVLAESDEYIICRFTNSVNTIFDSKEQHTVYFRDNDGSVPTASNKLNLRLVTSFSNGSNSNNSAEIIAYDPTSQRLFIANSIGARLDIISLNNLDNPTWVDSIDISSYGNINSVAVKNGIVACAIEDGTDPQANGSIVFFDTNGVYQNAVTVGAMPDMCTFNHAGTKVYVANEGEPNDAYTDDPEGSISVIDISGGITTLTNANVLPITFTSFNGSENMLRSTGVRIFGPGANTAQDLEPEYITISDDDTKAWVSLQENNAIAEIDLIADTIVAIHSLGYKNHGLMQNSLDATNKTDSVNLATYPVWGMYQPDAIAYYSDGSNMYVLTANEGDARDYGGFSEEERVDDLILDLADFPQRDEVQNEHVLGRLKTTSALGDFDHDGEHDSIFSYGARSFSIWNTATFTQTYDSKNEMELITASHPTYGPIFNASNGSSASFKNRSDDKGPEPEGILVETINGTPYAFIGLERIGGVMVYDITNPNAPQYVTYENNRTQDQGAEGLVFIPYTQSADSNNYLILANEKSSTLTIYKVEENCNSFQLCNATNGNDTTLVGVSSNVQDLDANSNVSYYTATCGLIANINSNTSALGTTTVNVFTDTSITTHNGQPFVARWYQITPSNNTAANVILFFTQDDFDNYNTYASANNWPLLPTSSSDLAGIMNIRITKNDNTGLGNNPLVLTPTTNWNSVENIWELSFSTPSFSQFRVHAVNNGNTPLPISNLNLLGHISGTNHVLSWTSSHEENSKYFNIQHSRNGIDFNTIAQEQSRTINGNSQLPLKYNFTYPNSIIGDHYYRLEHVDIDGTINLSNTIRLGQINNAQVLVYPSPVENVLNILIPTTQTEQVNINLFDLSGRSLISQKKKIDKNKGLITLDVHSLAEGVYNLSVQSSKSVWATKKIIKQ